MPEALSLGKLRTELRCVQTLSVHILINKTPGRCESQPGLQVCFVARFRLADSDRLDCPGLVSGLMSGRVIGLVSGLVIGLVSGLVIGLVSGLMTG